MQITEHAFNELCKNSSIVDAMLELIIAHCDGNSDTAGIVMVNKTRRVVETIHNILGGIEHKNRMANNH